MLTAARDWNYLAAALDWSKLKLPVEELENEQRCFTPNESQRIIEEAPSPWNICFAFMAYLGVRTAEAVGVAWQHLNLEAGVLMVRQSNWRGKP
jgi:integrase